MTIADFEQAVISAIPASYAHRSSGLRLIRFAYKSFSSDFQVYHYALERFAKRKNALSNRPKNGVLIRSERT